MLQLVLPFVLAPLVVWLLVRDRSLIRDRHEPMSETTKVVFILVGFFYAMCAIVSIWLHLGLS